MTIEVITDNSAWPEALSNADHVATECYKAVASFEPKCVGGASLLLTDNAHMRSLNSQFRHKNKPTNVLSFPGDQAHNLLGDIALGYETCAREARDQKIVFEHHIKHLIIHGLLHLLGYDHIEISDAKEMEMLEVKILATLDIDNPYRDEEKL